MFHHCVQFTWAEGTTPEQVDAMRGALAGIPAVVPGIRSYRFGVDAGLTDGNSQFGIVAVFDDVASYVAYRDHPHHQDVIARFVRPIVGRRHVIQFEANEIAVD